MVGVRWVGAEDRVPFQCAPVGPAMAAIQRYVSQRHALPSRPLPSLCPAPPRLADLAPVSPVSLHPCVSAHLCLCIFATVTLVPCGTLHSPLHPGPCDTHAPCGTHAHSLACTLALTASCTPCTPIHTHTHGMHTNIRHPWSMLGPSYWITHGWLYSYGIYSPGPATGSRMAGSTNDGGAGASLLPA